MSSLAMALAGYGIGINNTELVYGSATVATPQTFNTWLRANDGYTCAGGDCCNLVLSAPNKLDESRVRSLGEPLVPFYQTLQNWVADPTLVVLAHVQNQHHFVLLTGEVLADGSFSCNDPYYNMSSYPYSDIHDVLLYNML